MDDSDSDSDMESDGKDIVIGGRVMPAGLPSWAHGRRGKRVVSRADFSAMGNLFVV